MVGHKSQKQTQICADKARNQRSSAFICVLSVSAHNKWEDAFLRQVMLREQSGPQSTLRINGPRNQPVMITLRIVMTKNAIERPTVTLKSVRSTPRRVL